MFSMPINCFSMEYQTIPSIVHAFFNLCNILLLFLYIMHILFTYLAVDLYRDSPQYEEGFFYIFLYISHIIFKLTYFAFVTYQVLNICKISIICRICIIEHILHTVHIDK